MKKIALAALGAYGLVSAAGSLWGPNTEDFPSLQVKAPAVIKCWEESQDPPQEGHPCYDGTGGWWFGYIDQDARTEVRINGSYVEFAEGTSISDESDGSSLIDADALRVKFHGGPAESTAPSISGIGFNFNKPEGPENLSSKLGYCLTYESTGLVQFELGWNESQYEYDTWYVELPASSKKTVKPKWDLSVTTGKTSGDFKKDGWGSGIQVQPISTAVEGAYSLKIRLKNGTGSAVDVDFALYELGWNDECTGGVPILSNGAGANGLNLSLYNRMLSMTVNSPASVQILNLQGAVVHNQVYVPGSKMNLNNLPTGVYLVRIPSLGYSGKIMLK
ncbi:MAG: T9SS type A sorting domain-containing protein [Candidatus Fibromonas sp.]|jgi:hypothetical protein|nr:T9SS type A sorting domain-containing protein [Candidatus Fibromonas sp.]